MISQNIDAFLRFIRQCDSDYNEALAAEKDANDETQDLLHELELNEHKYHEYARLSKELAEVRKRRRIAKDSAACLEPIVCFASDNKRIIQAIERLLGDVRKAEKKLENRVYIPRKRTGE